jgi:hypothetical protein
VFLCLARALTFGSKSRRTHGYILLSHLRLPQPGGPGSCIYIPQEHGGPMIPLGTGFPFCRLLGLAGQRCRYFNPPPHDKMKRELSLVFNSLARVHARRLYSMQPPNCDVTHGMHTHSASSAVHIISRLFESTKCRNDGAILCCLIQTGFISCPSGLEKRHYGCRGSAALTMQQPPIRRSWH